jgi:hypothetical protein
MELILVKSSHIAAVEYLARDEVMLIRYHDGALYTRLGVTPSQYVAFIAAPSKGQFVNAMPNRALLISKTSRDMGTYPDAALAAGPARGGGETQAPPPQTFSEELKQAKPKLPPDCSFGVVGGR